MGFKLALAPILLAAIHFTANDNGQPKEFKFSLEMERLDEDDWATRVKDDAGNVTQSSIRKALVGITRGWRDQNLVLDDETGQPAAFSLEALEFMYRMPGFQDVALSAYIQGVNARIKN